MPSLLQNSSNALEVNSPPLSVRKQIMLSPASFSTSALKLLNKERVSDFSLKKCVQVLHDKSSIKLRIYLLLLLDVGRICQHELAIASLMLSIDFSLALHFGVVSLLDNVHKYFWEL